MIYLLIHVDIKLYILKKSFSFWSWKAISILGFLYRLIRSWMQQVLCCEILSAEHEQSSLEDVSVALGSASDLAFLRKIWGIEPQTNMRTWVRPALISYFLSFSHKATLSDCETGLYHPSFRCKN